MPLVTIGLPVRNAADRVTDVVSCVLGQDHADIELVISDNASTDDTEAVCRALADQDDRIRYLRQPENVGVLGNFRAVMGLGRGAYFRWIGDDDWIDPSYVSQCLAVIEDRPEALLVTTAISYTTPTSTTRTSADYDATWLASSDPVRRLEGILHYLNETDWFVDPLYGLMRRERVLALPRRNVLREDEMFATRLALAGPWAHVPAVLAGRQLRPGGLPSVARRLGVPAWQVRSTTLLLTRGILAGVAMADLDPAQRRRAHAAVARFYLRRHSRTVHHRARRLHGMALTAFSVARPQKAVDI